MMVDQLANLLCCNLRKKNTKYFTLFDIIRKTREI